MSPRWNKIIRDLWVNKSRTIVVVLAIAVGVVAFSSVFTTKAVLLAQMSAQYKAIKPTSITLIIPAGFGDELVRWATTQEGVENARGTGGTLVRIFTPQGARNVELRAVEDYSNMTINRVDPEKGTWPPQRKEIVLERTAQNLLPYSIGDTIEVETANGRRKNLTFAGTVHDLRAVPANLFPQLTGYVTFDTLRFLDVNDLETNLEIRAVPSITTQEQALVLGNQLKTELENRGFTNISVMADKPDKHWGEDATNVFVTILTIIGSFSLILSVLLVYNTVSAIITQQKKQIGIMKAVGARRFQITGLFLIMALSYGIIAFIIAIPFSALLGFGSLTLVADFLNLTIQSFSIPPSILGMEALASLVVPVIAALIPVLLGTRITVREAISDFSENKQSHSLVDRLINRMSMASRPVTVSLRNTFRKKGRLILTLVTLTIAGTLFVGVVGVRSSMLLELDKMLQFNNYDLELFLGEKYDSRKVITDAGKIEGVESVNTPFNIQAAWQESGADKKEFIQIQSLPVNSQFSIPIIMSGRNIEAGDTNRIVISNKFIKDNPSMEIGQTLNFKINDQTYPFEIIGVFLQPDVKIVLAPATYISSIVPEVDQVTSVQLKTTDHSPAFISSFAKNMEQEMKRRGYNVAYSLTINTIRSSSVGQFDFLVFFLLLMAALVAVVGGLGLAGTMSLNVLERTREIGVMRSIGASNGTVFRLVVVESICIGFISWLIAIPLSVPFGIGFCVAIGNAFFQKPLTFVFSVLGIIIWLVIVLSISVLASIAPAKKAVSLTVRETLAYE